MNLFGRCKRSDGTVVPLGLIALGRSNLTFARRWQARSGGALARTASPVAGLPSPYPAGRSPPNVDPDYL